MPTMTMHAARSRLLEALDVFVGPWTMEIRWSAETHKLVGGPPVMFAPVSFAWLEAGAFLVQRNVGGGAPGARWAIGPDDDSGGYTALYADDRGVSRVYQMSLADRAWQLWREQEGFDQRFQGRFSRDGRTIEGKWEKAVDGAPWTLDFELTYRRVEDA